MVVRVLPFMLAPLGLRILLQFLIPGWDGIFEVTSVTPFATATMFIMAVLLGGVLEDYKEAEKVPSELSNSLDSLSEKVCYVEFALKARAAAQHAKPHAHGHGAASHSPLPPIDSRLLHFELLQYLSAVLEYFGGLRTEQHINAITSTYIKYIAHSLSPYAHELQVELKEIFAVGDKLRSAMSRASIIKRTTFLPSGAEVLKLLVGSTVTLMALARYDGGATSGGAGGRRALSQVPTVTSYLSTASISALSNVFV